MIEIDGRFWLNKDGKNFLGSGRIKLLEEIEKTGSISAAAKAMKMSYKGAWERINEMDKLSEYPIIQKTTGGKGGGGTTLTKHAFELIKTFKRFEELHNEFMQRFAKAGDDPQYLARILSRTFLTTSARNQLPCKVVSLQNNGVNTLLKLQISPKKSLVATITTKSIQNMGLVERCDAYAIIKSSDVDIFLSKPDKDYANVFHGSIENIEIAEENSEICVDIDDGVLFVGIVDTKKAKKLKKAAKVYICIKKSHVILGL